MVLMKNTTLGKGSVIISSNRCLTVISNRSKPV